MRNKFAIAIPTYNEAENIQNLIVAIKKKYPDIKIFVVDDNSPDGTSLIVRQLSSQYSDINLLQRRQKQGLASAYLAAFQKILSDKSIGYIITMDADFSHDPADLKKLLSASVNFELVIGSRYVRGGNVENWNFYRRLLSRLGNLYAEWVTGAPIKDLTAGFVIYKRELLEKILSDGVKCEGYAYQIEMKYLARKYRAKTKEVPITFRERAKGKSKLNRGIVLEGIIAPWYLRFFRI